MAELSTIAVTVYLFPAVNDTQLIARAYQWHIYS